MKVQINVVDDNGRTTDEDYPTEDAAVIFGALLEEWANGFLRENAEYQGQTREFGKIGELIELTRKLSKLKAAWWHNVDTSDWREGPETILKELISHAFLAFVSSRSLDGPNGSR